MVAYVIRQGCNGRSAVNTAVATRFRQLSEFVICCFSFVKQYFASGSSKFGNIWAFHLQIVAQCHTPDLEVLIDFSGLARRSLPGADILPAFGGRSRTVDVSPAPASEYCVAVAAESAFI